MKQIYNFELCSPPNLNEKMLKDKLKKRKFYLQIVLIILSSILINISVIMLGVFFVQKYLYFTVISILYIVNIAVLAIIITILYKKKVIYNDACSSFNYN